MAAVLTLGSTRLWAESFASRVSIKWGEVPAGNGDSGGLGGLESIDIS